LSSPPNIIRVIKSRKMRWAGNSAWMGEMRIAYNTFVRKKEKNKPLGRPRYRWGDYIRLDLRDVGWEGVNWIHLA
jgi:hypothetical protein